MQEAAQGAPGGDENLRSPRGSSAPCFHGLLDVLRQWLAAAQQCSNLALAICPCMPALLLQQVPFKIECKACSGGGMKAVLAWH